MQIRVTQDGAVTLRSSTVFPNGKTLELSFVGTRASEAFGLKDVVKFERVPLEGQEAPQAAGYYPIVLLVGASVKGMRLTGGERGRVTTHRTHRTRQIFLFKCVLPFAGI